MDSGWDEQQKKTFTKWVNKNLRAGGFPAIEKSLEEDFKDGVTLIHLLHVVFPTAHSLPKVIVAPKNRFQMLENIASALEFVETVGIKTSAFLKPNNIYDGDLKMILGLIWQMILVSQMSAVPVTGAHQTSQEGLLAWCETAITDVLPGRKLESFSTSFSDGLVFLAMLYKADPTSVDMKAARQRTKVQNLKAAFEIAETKWSIIPMLEVEDMVGITPPDEKAVMTYVCEYLQTLGPIFKERQERLGRLRTVEIQTDPLPPAVPDTVLAEKDECLRQLAEKLTLATELGTTQTKELEEARKRELDLSRHLVSLTTELTKERSRGADSGQDQLMAMKKELEEVIGGVQVSRITQLEEDRRKLEIINKENLEKIAKLTEELEEERAKREAVTRESAERNRRLTMLVQEGRENLEEVSRESEERIAELARTMQEGRGVLERLTRESEQRLQVMNNSLEEYKSQIGERESQLEEKQRKIQELEEELAKEVEERHRRDEEENKRLLLAAEQLERERQEAEERERQEEERRKRAEEEAQALLAKKEQEKAELAAKPKAPVSSPVRTAGAVKPVSARPSTTGSRTLLGRTRASSSADIRGPPVISARRPTTAVARTVISAGRPRSNSDVPPARPVGRSPSAPCSPASVRRTTTAAAASSAGNLESTAGAAPAAASRAEGSTTEGGGSKLKKQWEVLSDSGKRRITPEDLSGLLVEAGYTTITKQQARHLFLLMDRNRDGLIGWTDFKSSLVEWMKAHPLT